MKFIVEIYVSSEPEDHEESGFEPSLYTIFTENSWIVPWDQKESFQTWLWWTFGMNAIATAGRMSYEFPAIFINYPDRDGTYLIMVQSVMGEIGSFRKLDKEDVKAWVASQENVSAGF